MLLSPWNGAFGVEFKLLGPIEVRNGQSIRALGGAKQRALLTLLVLHANEVVSRDRLIDALWGGNPGSSAPHRLETQISRLRKALGLGARLVGGHGGYALMVDPMLIDALRFERLVEDGRRHAAAGRTNEAGQTFREALSLWRGGALADLAYEPFARPEIERLEELRVAALEDRIEAELALGEGGGLAGELEGLVREHPYRERLRGQLMLALYRAGRQTDALATYRGLAGLLRDELGLEPSHSLRELEGAILRHDPSLAAPATRAPSAGHLPVPATPFLGRARELSEVVALVWGAGGRLVTLTGAGGSGKTRLALRAAQVCAGDYVGGAWFVGFADITDPELIAPVICQALGIVEQQDLTPSQRLEGYLRDRELLLVLDNLEQLTAGVGVLGELLAACPGVRMLVTSREPLHLAGEQQYEVPVLNPEDAIELFTARARSVAPSLTVERESVGAVCERLDRLPLAIELAAARTRVLSPEEILSRLERRLPVLASGPRDAPRRQRTLQTTIDWSYELLAEEEQRLLARLSVFAGGCTLQATEAVCGSKLDTLQGLVDRSLVRAGGGRYRMLQTLREYALEKLARSGEEDGVRRRHARWFVELLHAHGLDTYADPGVDIALGIERENFRAALEWAEQAGEIETVARLAAPLTRLWTEEGRLSEADRWLGVVRERSAQYPLALQALVLSEAREVAQARHAPEVVDLSEQALALYRELGDVGGMVREMSSQAGVAARRGDVTRGRALLEEALALVREHDLERWLPRTLLNLATTYLDEGSLDPARALFEEALALAPGLDPHAGVIAREDLAHIANLEHRYADAAELAREALDQAFAIGLQRTPVSTALQFARSLAELREPERAAQILGAALEFHREAGTAMHQEEAESEQAIRDALRAQLDERTFQALVEEGCGMTVEQAVREEHRQAEQRA